MSDWYTNNEDTAAETVADAAPQTTAAPKPKRKPSKTRRRVDVTEAQARLVIDALGTLDDHVRSFVKAVAGDGDDAHVVVSLLTSKTVQSTASDISLAAAADSEIERGVLLMSFAQSDSKRLRNIWAALAALSPDSANAIDGGGTGNDIKLATDAARLMAQVDTGIIESLSR